MASWPTSTHLISNLLVFSFTVTSILYIGNLFGLPAKTASLSKASIVLFLASVALINSSKSFG